MWRVLSLVGAQYTPMMDKRKLNGAVDKSSKDS